MKGYDMFLYISEFQKALKTSHKDGTCFFIKVKLRNEETGEEISCHDTKRFVLGKERLEGIVFEALEDLRSQRQNEPGWVVGEIIETLDEERTADILSQKVLSLGFDKFPKAIVKDLIMSHDADELFQFFTSIQKGHYPWYNTKYQEIAEALEPFCKERQAA